jgi:hypothetical protein
VRHVVRLFGALLLAMWVVAAPAYAQTTDWQELRTQRFAILYTPDKQGMAQQYARFVDGLYDEVAAIFGHRTATPVTLRLYPTLNSYYDANPLARGLTGVVAHADYRRHEVVVILDQTAQQTPDEVQNNVRHEMTHIVASDLSESRLNVMFQEGLAQYIEHPSRELENKIVLLRSVLAANGLLSWSDMNDRDTFYRSASISYPESLSIVAFLVDRYSFAKVRELLTVTASSSGYRSALERTFGVSPDQLEKEWHNWLPGYLAGGYKHNALVSYDLSKAQALLAAGRYADAQHELETAVEWLRSANQPQVLQQAEALLEQSLAAQHAESVAEQARAALESADFARAQELTAQAQQAYATVGDTRQNAVLQEYAARAARGLAAESTLQTAQQLSTTWHVLQARALADQAAADFAAIGATRRVAEAQAVRNMLDQRQSLAGIVLLALGAAGVVVSAVRSLTMREAEAW